MLYAPDDSLSHPRVAFAIGRRAGGAVQRNQLRRRVQAVLREHEEGVPAGRYLFGSRRRASTITFEEVVTDVTHLLDRAASIRGGR
jgi:ribonuclease P protein component